MAHAQTRTPYRYTNDLISVNAFFHDDLSTVSLTGARPVARDYRNSMTRVKLTMDPFSPNIDFVKATFDPSGNVQSAIMTDGPAVARCVFHSSLGDTFVSKPFTRLMPLEEGHPGTDSIFCYKLTPLSSQDQNVLFIEFGDGTHAIVLSEMVMGVSATSFAAKFWRNVDDTGARNVKRIALVETRYPDTKCALRLGRYAPEPKWSRFELDNPLVVPVIGVTSVSCESEMAFDQHR